MDVALVRAGNPSPYTLDGTNTWIVGREPAWVVDPGPDLAEHVADARSHDDLAKVAVQLSATAFEIAFLAAASREDQEPGSVQPA